MKHRFWCRFKEEPNSIRINEIKHIKKQTYYGDLAQSDKYLEAIIQCCKAKIFDEKVAFVFDFFIL